MEKKFFSKGIFEKPFMNSRITTPEMTGKEKFLGYLFGPFGTLALIAVINQLSELYYTEVFYIDRIFGIGSYLTMAWVTKMVSVTAGFVFAYMVEHSGSSQGKIRPVLLIGSLISAVSGFFMFYIPEMPDAAKLCWVYVFNILYNGIGMSLFGFRTNMYTLCTRNQNDRNQVNLIVQISSYLLVGVAVTMVVGSILYYTFLTGQPASHWILLVGVIAFLSIPLSFIHYYYTLERITMENAAADETVELEEKAVDLTEENRRNIWTQIKCLVRSRYWVLAFLYSALITIVGNLGGYNLNTNFCNVILGATAENNYNLIYSVASGLPMGIGILVIFLLAKKCTVRKMTMTFSVLCVVGCGFGYIAGNRFWPAIAASFIYNIGTLPNIYIVGALINSANDDVEYKYGFRPEGTLSCAILYGLMNLFTGVFSGLYETGLSSFGYDVALGTAQTAGVINWIYFVKYGVQIIQYVLIIVIMYFMDLEKKLPAMQEEIHRQHRGKLEASAAVCAEK